MANETPESSQEQLEDVADNAGARTAATNNNPDILLQEAKNAAAGEGPNGSGGAAPSSAEGHVPTTDESVATNIPSANDPNPEGSESTDEALSKSTKGH